MLTCFGVHPAGLGEDKFQVTWKSPTEEVQRTAEVSAPSWGDFTPTSPNDLKVVFSKNSSVAGLRSNYSFGVTTVETFKDADAFVRVVFGKGVAPGVNRDGR